MAETHEKPSPSIGVSLILLIALLRNYAKYRDVMERLVQFAQHDVYIEGRCQVS